MEGQFDVLLLWSHSLANGFYTILPQAGILAGRIPIHMHNHNLINCQGRKEMNKKKTPHAWNKRRSKSYYNMKQFIYQEFITLEYFNSFGMRTLHNYDIQILWEKLFIFWTNNLPFVTVTTYFRQTSFPHNLLINLLIEY